MDVTTICRLMRWLNRGVRTHTARMAVSECACVAYSVRITCKTVVATVSIVLIRYNRNVHKMRAQCRQMSRSRTMVIVVRCTCTAKMQENYSIKTNWSDTRTYHCAHLTHGSVQPNPAQHSTARSVVQCDAYERQQLCDQFTIQEKSAQSSTVCIFFSLSLSLFCYFFPFFFVCCDCVYCAYVTCKLEDWSRTFQCGMYP